LEAALNIIISSVSSEPIYEQIVRQIQKSIFNNEIEKGEKLPSIRTLAKDLEVSVITTKRAYEELERSGLIVTIPGKGSYVSDLDYEEILEKRKYVFKGNFMELLKEAKILSISKAEILSMISNLLDE
jgi:GntR family transcriptional regulator